MLLPDQMTFVQAACIPENWLTAFQLLFYEAAVCPGDTILVHAGGSGVAVALIQLAVSAGATVLVTAGSEAKTRHALALGAAHAFDYHEGFAEGVMRATDQKGVSVIFDCVGGSHAEQNSQVLALDGRWVLYGLLGGSDVPEKFLSVILRKRATLRGTTLRTRPIEYQERLVQDFLAQSQCLEKVCRGEFKLFVDQEYPLEEVERAHERMKDNVNIGKIVLNCA
jgi:tumor protein p53-inducible protein 3